jgi:hypothetical protein
MCLILAIVGFDFSSTTRGDFVYGDQGQEVAWEVEKERFVAGRGQEAKQHEVTRAFGGIGRSIGRVERHVSETIGVVEGDRLLDTQARSNVVHS